MNPELSRRVARVMGTQAMVSLPDHRYMKVSRIVTQATNWDEFPVWLQNTIEEGEREQAALGEYSPDQPRAPKGTSNGGQWVSAGGEPQSATDVGTSSTGLNERGLSAVRQIITDRRQGKVEWHDDEHGDEMLGAAQRAVGYADTPKIVSATEFDRMVSDDEMKVLYRGERKEQYVQDWKRGELYTGKGVYGNGTYTAVSLDSAKKYTGLDGDKALFRIGLPRTAKIIDNDALDDEMQAFERKLRATDKYLFNTPPELHAVIQEPGLYATLAGYDAIVARRGTYYVILNRAICFVTAEEPWNRS